jgi:hypothetical protein
MAIVFGKKTITPTNLVFLVILIILVAIIAVQRFTKRGEEKLILVPPFTPIQINFDFLESEVFSKLQLYEKIPSPEKMGRDNPFSDY